MTCRLPRTSRRLPWAVAIAAAVAASAVARSGSAQAPRVDRRQTPIRSGVELVPVDVSAIDRDGRPVDDLTAADFVLTVDGRRRAVASAEFIRTGDGRAPAPPAATHYSTNLAAATGRLIALVIDQGGIAPGRARLAAESAIRFVKRLSPSDRIALFAVPGPGVRIDFTSNHAAVLAQLPRIVGQAASGPGATRVGLGEATRIARGDASALGAAVARECTGESREMCAQELTSEAQALAADSRERTRNSLAALRAVMDAMAADQVPKTMVYVSEALVIDQDRSLLAWVGPLAARARIAVHVLRLEPSASDAAAPRRGASRSEEAAVTEEGLTLLAGLARGSLVRVAGNADGAFNRLSLEMSGYYLLGFEAEDADRDGKPHRIRVDVPGRRGIEVRARPDFTVEAPRTRTDEEALTDTLRSPQLATTIGLKATAYTFREPGSRRLRILIAADIDRTENPAGRVALGYALMNPRGALVASHFEPRVAAPVRGRPPSQRYVTAASVEEPGVYGLKLAVVDDAGRRGSVEHAFRAQLAPAGTLTIGDLLVADKTASGPGGAEPAVAGDFADPDSLHGYVELYSDSADALKDAAVTLEISARGDSRPLGSVSARFAEAGATDTRRVAEGTVPVALLPPGDYQARAVVAVGGRKAAEVTRPFRVLRSAAASGGGAVRGASPPRGETLALRVDPFQRAAVLTPQVVGFFLDRVGASGGTRPPPDAVEHARAGRFDAAHAAAQASGHALASALLEGLALYANADLEAAAVKFREALRIDSEFFAAAFYLGACYAAGGRDRDASAAWQTSLVTEGDAPFVYELLADALLRQRATDRALEILDEAANRWPAEPGLQWRRGAALAMSGKPAEALEVLDAYLAARPDDSERLFLALRLIYEARAAGRAAGTLEEERARFERYAAAYDAAGGAQKPLVEQWRRFLRK